MAYRTQVAITEHLKDSLHKIFLETVRSNRRITSGAQINWVTVPTRDPGEVQVYAYSDAVGAVTLGEYADYIEVSHNDSIELKARELGLMCASGFNILLNSAIKNHGKNVYATDLITNNVRFTVTSSPNVADPAGILLGYMSYKYYFAAGKPLLLTPKEFLEKVWDTAEKIASENRQTNKLHPTAVEACDFAKAYADYLHSFKSGEVSS